MAYTLPTVAYGSGKPKPAPPLVPLALAEARVSQVEAELRLALVQTQVSCLEERLCHVEAELAGLLRDPCGNDSPSDNQSAPLL